MKGTDYAQTRLQAIEAKQARIDHLQDASGPIRYAIEQQLAELKREAKIFLLDGGHPRSDWNKHLEAAAYDRPSVSVSTDERS